MANPTIKDVAKHAGVSIATVSRVINDNYFVSSDTKEKVYTAIEELHYLPNSIARSLKGDSTHTIGFIVSNISNTYFTSVAKAIEDIISKDGYSLFVCSTENIKEREQSHLELLASKKVDGIILNTTGKNNDLVTNLAQSGLPIVLIDRKVDSDGFIGDFITNDNIEGSYNLTSHLLSLNHRKIAIINGILSVSSGVERYRGFVKAMEIKGISVADDYPYQYEGDFTVKSGYKAAEFLMSLPEMPTAIIGMNNNMTMGALMYLRENKINVPEQVSVASYGDLENWELMYIEPTVLTLNTTLLGQKAAEMIIERIEKNNEIQNRHVIYFPQFIIRGTTKAI